MHTEPRGAQIEQRRRRIERIHGSDAALVKLWRHFPALARLEELTQPSVAEARNH
jgi:hypothetical protein